MDADIRRMSPTLRRLLVDNDIQKAWKLCGFEREPKVTLRSSVANAPSHDNGLVFSQNVEIDLGEAKIGPVQVFNRALSDEEIRQRYEESIRRATGSGPSMGLSRFLDYPIITVSGTPITGRELIKYVANKLGGAHFDPQNRDHGLESISQTIKVFDRDPLYLSGLGIIQTIVASDDIKKLIATAKKLATPGD